MRSGAREQRCRKVSGQAAHSRAKARGQAEAWAGAHNRPLLPIARSFGFILVFILVSVLLFPAIHAHATVRHVPDSYPAPQLALNAALPGDTVVVAAGTYVGNIIWPNRRGISMIGEAGATDCILDGDDRETVIGLYHASIDSTTLIRGFTLTGGFVEGM
ncbi:MAG: hypothetical protein KBD56_08410 [Candidatus Eisenbacteria bacterium]|nr:hypothetical protein [Candidatus Eisenbacteria bacterium]